MKRISSILLAFIVLISASSCAKQERQSPLTGELSTVSVTVGATAADLTKAAGLPEEDTQTINSVQVFVFRGGEFVNRSDNGLGATTEMALETDATGLDFDFVVVANNYCKEEDRWVIDFNDIVTPDDIFAKVADLATLTPDNLLMAGRCTRTVSLDSRAVDITVRRLVAKVELRKITVNLQSDLMRIHNMTLQAVYVINAVSRQTVAGTTPDEEPVYYNKYKAEEGPWNACTYDVKLTPFPLNIGSTRQSQDYTIPHDFFVFSNATSLHTRLVIEVLYNGRDRLYYATDLGEVEAGKAYTVTRANIKGPGSLDPAVDPDKATFSVSATVLDWETGFEKEIDL